MRSRVVTASRAVIAFQNVEPAGSMRMHLDPGGFEQAFDGANGGVDALTARMRGGVRVSTSYDSRSFGWIDGIVRRRLQRITSAASAALSAATATR